MDPAAWRPLTDYELSIASRLLEVDFPTRDVLLSQLPGASVRTVEECKDDYGSIEFDGTTEGDPSFAVSEATALDSHGVPILYLLHERSGRLFELEIVKMDASKLLKRPEPTALEVTAIR